MTAHPWHEVDSSFDRNEGVVSGIVEIPLGSKAKYEVDKISGLLRLDRVIFSAFHYPINYGFIPRSLGDDGDPLDILVLSQVSIAPLCLVKARIIGYMEMIDSGQRDEKIIAVADGDMSVNHITSIELLPENFRSELKHFFLEYKTLSNKIVLVDQFKSKGEALDVIEESLERYKAHFSV
ncbi:MAG: inorganic diphosphatase [Crocinitomicaceae bacterium]|nr:inorganic diphosphatase [Crocinitomicaceae bacterium]